MRVNVGKTTDVPTGRMHVVTVAGSKVALASVDGRMYAFDDTCTHLGCSLAEGDLDGTTVTCACHGSQFDITTGAVLRGPATRPVRARTVEIEGEDLSVEA